MINRTFDTIGRVLDRATDLAVVAFAAWTVVYHLGLLTEPPTWGLLLAWLGVGVLLGGLYAWRLTRPSQARDRVTDPDPARPPLGYWAFAAITAGAVAGTVAGVHQAGPPWWIVWVAGSLSVAATAVMFVLARGVPPEEPAVSEDRVSKGTARADGFGLPPVLVAAGCAIGSLFLVNTDGDDAFFVSRSVWTAAHGHAPTRDTVFTQGAVPPIAGEPPVSSLEVLVGALARPLGVPAASFLWYVILPGAVFLSVWALWRLVREWAPRRALACFAVAVVYLLWSGESFGSMGAFHMPRMWQGKAMLVSVLVPLLYVYLTRWAERRSTAALGLAVATGVAATGLSSTAVLLVPLVVAAVVGPMLVTGRIRTGLTATAVLAYPVGAGLLVTILHLGGDGTMVEGEAAGSAATYSAVLLAGTLGVLGGCALYLGPWLTRPGAPALIAGGVAAVATVLFVDGVLGFIGSSTGAGPVMWRTLWVVPAPVLVGLLAATALPAGAARRIRARVSTAVPWTAAGAVPAVLLGGLVVAVGVPVWSQDAGTLVEDQPSWKAVPGQLRTARVVVKAAEPGGTVLMPQRYMRTVPFFGIGVNAVNPNTHQLEMLGASETFTADRRLLTELVLPGREAKPTAVQVRGALDRVDVTVACAFRRDAAALRLIAAAGYGERFEVGRLSCLRRGRG